MNLDYSEKIIDRCLSLDDLLQTIKKALEQDGQSIDGFTDHYSDLVQQALDLNWENHDLATKISFEDYKLDRIRELLDK